MNLLLAILGFLLLIGSASAVVFVVQACLCAREVRNPPRRSVGWALARGFASDPGEAELPFEAWTLERTKGIELPVWEIPEETRSSQSPILIMLHGWGQSRIEMLALLTKILEKRRKDGHERSFRTFMPDLRGHGEASSGSTTLGQEDAEDLQALIERAGPGPVILLGFSLGGVTAITLAARRPNQVHGVLALAPYERLLTPIAATLRSRQMPHGLTAKLVTCFSTTGENRRRLTSESASGVTCGLHVFVGGHDRIAPPEVGRAIVDRAPDAILRINEEVGHVGLPEASVEVLADDLETLLRDAVSGS